MKIPASILSIALALPAGQVHADHPGYLYFPDLAERVLAGEADAFRQILVLSRTTAPGERLEELAELSSRFVRIAPEAFLRAQVGSPNCFGVSFLGPAYVDDSEAREVELAARRAALVAVADPALADAKRDCLAHLGD